MWSSLWIPIALAKCIFLFSSPQLSNDYYRYWWDGWLLSHSVNPYAYTPIEIIHQGGSEAFVKPLLEYFPLLNSREYHSVYPILSQLIFCIASTIAGSNLYLFALIVKIIFLITDLLSLKFLLKISDVLQTPGYFIALYFGSPFILAELSGNLHVEQLMVCLLIMALYYYITSKGPLSGFTFGLSFISKLNVLLFAPFLVRNKTGWNWSIKWIAGFIAAALPFIWILANTFRNYQGSLKLYFGQFEFNSFLYIIIRDSFFERGWYELKNNAALICLLPFAIIYLIIWLRPLNQYSHTLLFKSIWLCLFAFLIFSTTVHPWYLAPLLLIGLFSFPLTSLVWTVLVFLSYAHYDSATSSLNYIFTRIEYFLVLATLALEIKWPGTFQNLMGNSNIDHSEQ